MDVRVLEIPPVAVVHPRIHGDERGFFVEAWNQRVFDEAIGPTSFVQDNHSKSARGVLRGLHYQLVKPQGKLVRCAVGSVFDVAVDIRPGSSTFGGWVGVTLSASEMNQLWIPPGFAHGFVVLSDTAEVLYKATEYYHREYDRAIRWDDPDIGLQWPDVGVPFILSDKDRLAPPLREAEIDGREESE